MKFQLWYSCYIDLVKGHGVASAYIRDENQKIKRVFSYHENTTINGLNLEAVAMGLSYIPEGSSVVICGVSKYVDTVLTKLDTWVNDQEELDIKAHSSLLKSLWELMTKQDKISTQFFKSRKAHPMLWATSQCSREEFRSVQLIMIENLKAPVDGVWSYKHEIDQFDFLQTKFQIPFTDIQVEKRILKRRDELKNQNENYPDNVIRFPGA